MRNIKYQLVKFTVKQAREKVRIDFDTNNLYEKVDGIYISLPFEANYKNTRYELKMNGEEIFPTDFEVKLLATNQSVAPNSRFFSLKDEDIPAKGNHAESIFTDGGMAESYPYEGFIYLKLVNIPKPQ